VSDVQHDSETKLEVITKSDLFGNVTWYGSYDFPNGNTQVKDRILIKASGSARWAYEGHTKALATLEDMRGAWAHGTLPEDQYETYFVE